ncbi:vegetative cell wall protein gp1-like [Rhagoletis pomonella]|uniref:vegetative cell wall protein gp1-like n=1 Tax=Rhagoletis pomonella TaxID=28610 RepID=UPI001783569C|nr:vegetative cell wall protein gp1-like [Rhagoletis pomonella]
MKLSGPGTQPSSAPPTIASTFIAPHSSAPPSSGSTFIAPQSSAPPPSAMKLDGPGTPPSTAPPTNASAFSVSPASALPSSVMPPPAPTSHSKKNTIKENIKKPINPDRQIHASSGHTQKTIAPPNKEQVSPYDQHPTNTQTQKVIAQHSTAHAITKDCPQELTSFKPEKQPTCSNSAHVNSLQIAKENEHSQFEVVTIGGCNSKRT